MWMKRYLNWSFSNRGERRPRKAEKGRNRRQDGAFLPSSCQYFVPFYEEDLKFVSPANFQLKLDYLILPPIPIMKRVKTSRVVLYTFIVAGDGEKSSIGI